MRFLATLVCVLSLFGCGTVNCKKYFHTRVSHGGTPFTHTDTFSLKALTKQGKASAHYKMSRYNDIDVDFEGFLGKNYFESNRTYKIQHNNDVYFLHKLYVADMVAPPPYCSQALRFHLNNCEYVGTSHLQLVKTCAIPSEQSDTFFKKQVVPTITRQDSVLEKLLAK